MIRTLGTAPILLAAIVLAAAGAGGARAVELTDANYEKVRDTVLPKQEELGFRAIPWRVSFWDAVVEAQAKDRPILLWAMNGHPLACT